MQGIYTIFLSQIMSLGNSVAAILLLLFTVLISLVSVLNLLYFPKYVCSAQYGYFLEFLDFKFSWYVAHVFSKWLWNSPSRPYYYWYHLSFYIPHALYFYCKVLLLLLLLLLPRTMLGGRATLAHNLTSGSGFATDQCPWHRNELRPYRYVLSVLVQPLILAPESSQWRPNIRQR